jgi:hypothetical protein
MRITSLNLEKNGRRVRSSAKVEWEECDRSPQTINFETEQQFSNDTFCDPHSFLVASVIPALYFGERRLHIDEEICPQLKEGLFTALRIIHHWWYPSDHKIPSIEAKCIKTYAKDEQNKCTSFCFSGGVDSMATLYHNHLLYPKEHPRYLREGLVVFGLEVQDLKNFKNVLNLIGSIAEGSGLKFIPVYSNIIELGPKDYKELWHKFWLNQYMSCAFAAIAHAFSGRWHSFFINASHDIPNLIPHGSNPLLAPCFGRWGLRISEVGIDFSRFEKVQMIANWDLALNNLRVCNRDDKYTDEVLNCGQCEKCVRTMLAFEALGALKRSTSFPIKSVTVDMVKKLVHITENKLGMYKELMGPLRKSGREDLAKAVELKVIQYFNKEKNEKWKKPILEFDKKYFSGTINHLKRKIDQSLGKK